MLMGTRCMHVQHARIISYGTGGIKSYSLQRRRPSKIHGAQVQQHTAAHLEGDVEELAQLWQRRTRADEALGEVPRVRRRKADALDALHRRHCTQQVRKGMQAAAAGIRGQAW